MSLYRSSQLSDIKVVIKGPSISCAPASALPSDALEVLDEFPGHKSQLGTSSSVMQEQVRRLGFFDGSRLQRDLVAGCCTAAAAAAFVVMQLLLHVSKCTRSLSRVRWPCLYS
jgi:hypothetical protein